MATTVRSLFFAATAAVSLALSACGGGDDISTSQAQDAAAAKALTGPVVVDSQVLDLSQSKKRPLAVSASVSTYGFQAIITAEALGQTTKKAQAAAVSPSGITPDDLGNWAERVYPDLFPSHQTTGSITGDFDGDGQSETYSYRLYPETGNCYGVRTAGKDVGGLYLCGTFVGGQIVRYGSVDDRAIKCTVNVDVLGCRPRVTSVKPADGATNVATQNVAIVANFDQRLQCPNGPITGTFGIITGTLTCANTATAASVTIVAATLPDNSKITTALSGFLSADGLAAMVEYTWSFTTEKKVVPPPVVKVVTVNANAYLLKTGVVSVIDPTTKAVNQVALDQAPGYLWPVQIDVDSARGIAYIGALGTYVLHRVDLVSGKALGSFFIDAEHFDTPHGHGIHGIAHSVSGTVCIATGIQGMNAQYYWRNRFICFDPATGQKVFTSPNDFLGDVTMIPTKVLYSAAHKKFYVLSATEAALYLQTIGNATGRDGYQAGTVGIVTEIDAVTYQKGRAWNVGSMPLDGKIRGNLLYVVNAGDRSLSKIDLSNANTATAVRTVDWTHIFTGPVDGPNLTNPTGIEIDTEKGVYYVPDWVDSVRVMSLVTDQQVGRVTIGDVPWGMGIANGSLWVAAPKKAIWAPTGDSVFEIDRATWTIKNTVVNVGAMPYSIAIYDTSQP